MKDKEQFNINLQKILDNLGGDDNDVSNWMDSMGCCKICGGEIPHGHLSNCVIYAFEKRIKHLEEQVRYWRNEATFPFGEYAEGDDE